jgi:hypothetical protein
MIFEYCKLTIGIKMTKKFNDFLNEFDIFKFLECIQNIKKKYNFDKDLLEKIDENLYQIDLLLKSPPLQTAIISEFSGGKSSFINAILQEPILYSDDKIGTTTAMTWIKYGNKRDVMIHTDDQVISYQNDEVGLLDKLFSVFSDPNTVEETEKIEAFISKITTMNLEKSSKIKKVEILYPKEILKDLTFIDTTFFQNYLQIQSEIDTYIFLIPISVISSNYIFTTINQYLENINDRIIIVVNHVDLIDYQNDQVKDLIYSKINYPKKIPIFFISSKNILDQYDRKKQVNSLELDKMHDFLVSQKNIVNLSKIFQKASWIFLKIREYFKENALFYFKQIEHFKQITPIDHFLSRKKYEIGHTVKEIQHIILRQIRAIFNHQCEQLINQVQSDITNIQAKGDLYDYVGKGIENRTASSRSIILNKIEEIDKHINQLFAQIFLAFQQDLFQQYEGLMNKDMISIDENINESQMLKDKDNMSNHHIKHQLLARIQLDQSHNLPKPMSNYFQNHSYTNPYLLQSLFDPNYREAQKLMQNFIQSSPILKLIDDIASVLNFVSFIASVGNFIGDKIASTLEDVNPLKEKIKTDLHEKLSVHFKEQEANFQGFFLQKTTEDQDYLYKNMDHLISECQNVFNKNYLSYSKKISQIDIVLNDIKIDLVEIEQKEKQIIDIHQKINHLSI